MRDVGLHIRLTTTINDLGKYAASLNIPLFQCFLIHQSTNHFIHPDDNEIEEFLHNWRPRLKNIYVHGSY